MNKILNLFLNILCINNKLCIFANRNNNKIWKEHTNHQEEREETNTVSEKECRQLMDVEFLLVEEKKEEKNLRFLARQDQKDNVNKY